MDNIDVNIINELKAHGKMSVSEVSKRVNLSIPAVAERIKKLEQYHIIEKYTIKVNRKAMGQKLLVFLLLTIDGTENIEEFRTKVVRLTNVLECHHIAGQYDYLLKVLVKDTEDLEGFLMRKLKKIKGVSSSSTILCLSSLKEEINL